MVVTRSSPSPTANAIPALPPKRRLSLSSLSPNVPSTDNQNSKNDSPVSLLIVQETRNSTGIKESSRSLVESATKARTSSTSKRPPRNPPSISSSKSTVATGKSIQNKQEVYTPNSHNTFQNANQSKIHYADDEDVLKIPDPPTPVETTSIKLAAAKLLENRAKRRMSLPNLRENHDGDLLSNRMNVSCNTAKRICNPSPTSKYETNIGISSVEQLHLSMTLNKTNEDLHGSRTFSSNAVATTIALPDTFNGSSPISFDDSKIDNVDSTNLQFKGNEQNRIGKNRKSILLPSDAHHCEMEDGEKGFLQYKIQSTTMTESMKQNPILFRCDKPQNDDVEKLNIVKKAVRKLCNLPFDKRYQCAEAILIEELTGYPLVSRASSSGIQKSSTGNTMSDDLENFNAPNDLMKVELIKKLSPYIEFLEDKRKADSDTLEISTGFRVAKGKNGRYIYSDIKSGLSVCPKEYERAYRSANIKSSSLNDAAQPNLPLALDHSILNEVSTPISSTDNDNLIAIDLSHVLQKYQKPTSKKTLVVEAQRRLYDAVDNAIRTYYKDVR